MTERNRRLISKYAIRPEVRPAKPKTGGEPVAKDRATKLLDAVDGAFGEFGYSDYSTYRRRALRLIREALAEQREESRDAGLMDGRAAAEEDRACDPACCHGLTARRR